MIDTPQITHTEHQHTAVIHMTIPREKMREVMGPAIQEIMGAVGAQGVNVAGPMFTHHFKITPETFDFEVGFPVSAPVKQAGRVKASEWPAMKVVRAVHLGGYEGLAGAWGEFDKWIKANELSTTRDIWESYAAGPESSPDPATWRTELHRPLAS